jgi:hypothetical protein
MSPPDLFRRRSTSPSRGQQLGGKSNAIRRRSHSPSTLLRGIKMDGASQLPMKRRKSDGSLDLRSVLDKSNPVHADRTFRRGNSRDRSGPDRRGSHSSHQQSAHGRIGHDERVHSSMEHSGHMRKEIEDENFCEGKLQSSEERFRMDKRMPPRSNLRGIAQREGITWVKFCSYFIPILILVCSGVGLVVATGNTPDALSDAIGNLIPTFDNSELQDPSSGTDLPKWAGEGNGLRVTIINALSDDWQVPFELATSDWDLGSPDAVDINVEVVPHEIDCKAEQGKVKVCNGDYGDVKWRGVNEAMLDPKNYIVETAVRMNEFYLLHMDKGAWQYTMCHEIGML